MSEATRTILGKIAARVLPQLHLVTALDGPDAASRHADGESATDAASDQAAM